MLAKRFNFLLFLFNSRGTEHVIGTLSNEATSDMGKVVDQPPVPACTNCNQEVARPAPQFSKEADRNQGQLPYKLLPPRSYACVCVCASFFLYVSISSQGFRINMRRLDRQDGQAA